MGKTGYPFYLFDNECIYITILKQSHALSLEYFHYFGNHNRRAGATE